MSRTLSVFLLLISLTAIPAQEWTRFRGPNGIGISTAKTIPTTWTDKDVNWRLPLAGEGHSSPVLWGDSIFLTTADGTSQQVTVFCVSAATGGVLWQKSFPFESHHKNSYNSFASASPAVDRDRLYVCWTSPSHYMLVALTHEGRKVWEKDLGPFASQHGGGTSPIVYADKVVLGNEQDGGSFLIAVDAATGETQWRTPRTAKEAVYSTPCVFEPKGRSPVLIFTSHAHGVSAIQPDSGKVLWELPDLFDKRVVSSPVLAGSLIVGTCGSGGGGNYLTAIRPGGSEAKPEVAYTVKRAAPYVPTSVCVGDRLYLWGDTGTVSCLEASSGNVKWQERVGGSYFSSPVWVDGRLFCISTKGECVVIAASDRFELLARNALGEVTHSTPAVAGGRMYIHTAKSLISIGGRAARQPQS